MTVRVRLSEGFQNNTVSVRANGEQVYRKDGVSTDLSISWADGLDIPAGDGPVRIEVSVDGKPGAGQTFDPRETPFVDVRLVGGEVVMKPMREEPPML